MSTYAELAASTSAKVVWWVEFSGLPWAFSDGTITESNKSTLFTDAYTPTLTFSSSLMPLKNSFSRSIELLTGRGTTAGIEVQLLDWTSSTYPDGFFTWLFGAERPSIGRTRLAEEIEIDEDQWILENTYALPVPAFNTSALAYCRLETVRYYVQYEEGVASSSVWDPVERSAFKSPSITHRAATDGVLPEVTDHPTVWAGRIVTLYQTYMDGAGVLANNGSPATARAAAKKFRGILRDISWQEDGDQDFWTVRCDGIDTLLKRKILRGQPKAPIAPPIIVQNGTVDSADIPASMDGSKAPVASVILRDPSAWDSRWKYYIQIDGGTYTRSEFLEAVNAELANDPLDILGNSTWVGTLSCSVADGLLTFTYHTSSVPGEERICDLNLQLAYLLPGTFVATNPTAEYWYRLGVPDGTSLHSDRLGDTNLPAVDTDYTWSIPCGEIGQITLYGGFWTPVAVGSNVDGFDATDFPVDQWVVVVSADGMTLAKVIESSGTDTLKLRPALSDGSSFVHHWTPEQPIEIRACFYLRRSTLHSAMLRLLLSTAAKSDTTHGFNHATYDVENEGIGIGFPCMSPSAGADENDSLIDVESFIRFALECEVYADGTVDFIYEPTEMLDWLVKRMAFLGGYIVITDGKLRARRGLTPLISASIADLTRKELLPGRSLTTGDAPTTDGVTYHYAYSHRSNQFLRNGTFVRGNQQSDDAQNFIEYEDKGLRTSDDQVALLATEVLAEFGKENRLWSLRVDRALFLEPSDVVTYSDEGYDKSSNDAAIGKGAPNLDGTRGHTGDTFLMVLDATVNHEEQTTEIRAIESRLKRSGYAPSAWVTSFTNVGAAVLTCEANVFRDPADGTDASAFEVGDKVRILRLNGTQVADAPTTSVQNGEVGHTIAGISGNAITLTGTLAGGYTSGTTPIVLVFDPYQTGSQTDDAKGWCHAGDSSGDIGDTGDGCYEW